MTIIAAITLEGVQAAMTVDAATDTDVFGAFVTQILVPTLRPGQIVIMDNLAAHKVDWIEDRIKLAGCSVLFLPPYSPDYSPIEHMWSKVKQQLRSAGQRTIAALNDAIAEALAAITPSDCAGYFRHCGYSARNK